MKTKRDPRPLEARPPLVFERLSHLVGRSCRVQKKTGAGRWCVEIQEVRFVNSLDAIVMVAGGRMFGHARKVPLSEIDWSGKR